jgi:catechol 2,3-dioxygenase-like lactoylglutathione lyase family enzyme
MPHGLDHIVHAVRDLDAAAEFYAGAGFTVGARNRHARGTRNRIVQSFLKAFAGVPPHAAHCATLIFETVKEG